MNKLELLKLELLKCLSEYEVAADSAECIDWVETYTLTDFVTFVIEDVLTDEQKADIGCCFGIVG